MNLFSHCFISDEKSTLPVRSISLQVVMYLVIIVNSLLDMLLLLLLFVFIWLSLVQNNYLISLINLGKLFIYIYYIYICGGVHVFVCQ